MSDRITTLRAEPVEHVPDALARGILYVSQKYGTAIHLCACGCGEETVTPLHGDGWTLSAGPTLRPSIGQRLPCRSHYYVTDGRIEWL